MADFASTRYAAAFENLPQPNREFLRQSTLDYLASFEPRSWYEDPITSLYLGQKLAGDKAITTEDALGKPNGSQYYASELQLTTLKNHIRSFQSPHKDLRPQLRAIEEQLLTTYAGLLIGNQCLDFQKQDGITELEESIMANAVERRLNDMLLDDEMAGKLTISRRPIYVSCVSNFTNFLDLFRKTVRSLELGIPCVVLGRCNNAQQHSYRWALLLMELMNESAGCHPGMLTFLSASLDDIKDVTQSCQEFTGNLYATCSRALASEIMKGYGNIVASTGGPNTLITTEWTESVCDAIRMSATIESSGQCTALRHCVVPDSVTPSHITDLWNKVVEIPSASHAVNAGIFDGIYAQHEGSAPPKNENQYSRHDTNDVYFCINEKLPPNDIKEYWRKVVVDFSRLDLIDTDSDLSIEKLADWLNRHQPISLAVNARRSKVIDLGRQLFEKTGLVVYTLGSTDSTDTPPALTCQARPQEAEIFGEFPPRAELGRYTKYPVIVPSSTPSYDAHYNLDYLAAFVPSGTWRKDIHDMVNLVVNKSIQGYCWVLLEYLLDATQNNPKQGFGTSRTALWGLQRPPLGSKTCIRCNPDNTWDDIAPVLLLFYSTNARDQFEISLDPECKDILSVCRDYAIHTTVEKNEDLNGRTKEYYNVVNLAGPTTSFPPTGLFTSLYLPLGHIKSTKPNDQEFLENLRTSIKWLKLCPESEN